VIALGAHLKNGVVKSCGCLKRDKLIEYSTKHGHARVGRLTRTFRIWRGMLSRCSNKNATDYQHYGGMNLRVCKRWQESYTNFLADMGECPSSGHSIGRIRNSVGYTKSNCTWQTRIEQARNRRSNKQLTLNGTTLLLVEWAEKLNVPRQTISARLRRGWSVQEALITPVGRRCPR